MNNNRFDPFSFLDGSRFLGNLRDRKRSREERDRERRVRDANRVLYQAGFVALAAAVLWVLYVAAVRPR